jgi:hypothetical protein
MTPDEITALARPALRRLGQCNRWVPAPANPQGVSVKSRDVHRLVKLRALKWGNRCQSFVVKTAPDE